MIPLSVYLFVLLISPFSLGSVLVPEDFSFYQASDKFDTLDTKKLRKHPDEVNFPKSS